MVKCKYCQTQLKNSKNKFCNNSCAASYNNKKFPKRTKKEIKCKQCSKAITTKYNIFCDVDCFRRYTLEKITIPKFNIGEIKWNSTIRKVLFYLYGEVCSECGLKGEWNGLPLVIQVDHIDGNSDNCMPNNVRLLCPNCHSQTKTFSGGGERKDTKRNKYLRKHKGYEE